MSSCRCTSGQVTLPAAASGLIINASGKVTAVSFQQTDQCYSCFPGGTVTVSDTCYTNQPACVQGQLSYELNIPNNPFPSKMKNYISQWNSGYNAQSTYRKQSK